jgi:hypothetical protein
MTARWPAQAPCDTPLIRNQHPPCHAFKTFMEPKKNAIAAIDKSITA